MILEILNKILNNTSLNEDLNDIKKNFTNITDNLFKQIISLDPTYRQGSNSAGKYGKWLLNIYNKGNLNEDNFSVANSLLKEFEEKKEWFENKDIQQFKSLDALRTGLNNVKIGELSNNQKDKRFKKQVKKFDLNANKVYEDDIWEVWVPYDYNASCKLSGNTEWCTGISSKGNPYWFNHYTKDKNAILYILLNKKDINDKYQFCIQTGEFRDRKDDSIKIYSFFNKDSNKGLKKFFYDNYPQLNSLSPENDIATEGEALDLTDQLNYTEEIQYVQNIADSLDDIIEFNTTLNNFLNVLRRLGNSDAYNISFISDLFKDPYEAGSEYKLSRYDHSNDMYKYFSSIKSRLLKEPKFVDFLNKNNLTIDDFEKEVNAEQINTDSIAEQVLFALDESYLVVWIDAYLDCLKEDIISAYKFEDGFEGITDIKCSIKKSETQHFDSELNTEIHAIYPKDTIVAFLNRCFIEREGSHLYDRADEYCLDKQGNFDLNNFINYVACSLIDIRNADELFYDEDLYNEDLFVKYLLENLDYIEL